MPMPNIAIFSENASVIRQSLEAFEASMLSEETSVKVIGLDPNGFGTDSVLDAGHLESYLNDQRAKSSTADIFFINRHLVKAGAPWPKDANKLRLSAPAFELLCSHLQISPTFVASLANIHQPSPRGFPCQAQTSRTSFNFWLFIPVRVQVQCSDKRRSHLSSSDGKSQMNPLNYLHLSQSEVDIRGSKIAIYYAFNSEANTSSTLVFNFQDGRWRKIVEEPIARLKEALGRCSQSGFRRDPIYIQSVFMTSALRLWNNALYSFNDQLIAYEETLLTQDLSNNDLSQLNSDMNRSLHCMAAHLHHYSFELSLLSDVIQDIKWYNSEFHKEFVDRGVRAGDALESFMGGLEQIISQLSVISRFRNELQEKIDNVLALLVDNAQAANDRLLVQNSKAMQAILHASQTEAEQSRHIAAQTRQLTEEMTKILQATQTESALSRRLAIQSQRLTEEMMTDSVAMKTIALLTAFFLPGTSFAAILAMPFFSGNPWLSNIGKFWIWIVLTIPSTTLCFAFYFTWNHRESRRKKNSVHEEEEMVNIIGS